MDDNEFLSELERCILANSSSPTETNSTSYSSEDLASMYLNGEYNEIDEDELDENGYHEVSDEEMDDDEDDQIQIIYIDDTNFNKLDPDQIKTFISQLSIILGVSPYSDDEVNKFIAQCKKPKE